MPFFDIVADAGDVEVLGCAVRIDKIVHEETRLEETIFQNGVVSVDGLQVRVNLVFESVGWESGVRDSDEALGSI